MLLLLYLPVAFGLAIVSRVSFEDSPKLKEDAKTVDSYLITRRTNTTQRITRRKPEPKLPKTKIFPTERTVPIIKGAASSKEAIAIYDSEDLHPPHPGASDSWVYSQNVESNTRYPDSNDYFPNVGPYPSGRPTTPRPVYGAPPSNGGTPSWCPTGQGGSWGQNGNNNWGQGNGGYRPGQGGYPPSNSGGSWGQGGQNPSGGSWGQSGSGQGGGYPPSSSGESYPPSNSGGGWGQGSYPPSNNGGSWGQGSHPPSSGGGSWGQGSYPPSNSGGSWGQTGGGGDRYPPSQGAGWSKASRQGKWVPCQPYDLTANGNRREGGVGCPQESTDRGVFVPPLAPPTNKIHDKVSSDETYNDVELVNP